MLGGEVRGSIRASRGAAGRACGDWEGWSQRHQTQGNYCCTICLIRTSSCSAYIYYMFTYTVRKIVS